MIKRSAFSERRFVKVTGLVLGWKEAKDEEEEEEKMDSRGVDCV